MLTYAWPSELKKIECVCMDTADYYSGMSDVETHII